MVRIAFFGAGGVGGWLAARVLEAKSAEVVLIARGAHGTAIAEKGLCLKPERETLQFPPGAAEVYPSVEDAVAKGAAKVDFVILCVKTYQVRGAAKESEPLLLPSGCVVTTQNGLEAPQTVAEEVGCTRVMGGVCKVLAYIGSPGVIEMPKTLGSFVFGECFDESGAAVMVPNSERAQILANILSECKGSGVDGFGVAHPSTWHKIWEKAMMMCTTGPVTALCRAPIDQVCTIPETRTLMKSATLEIIACGAAAGYLGTDGRTHDEIVEGLFTSLKVAPPNSTASTSRDIITGKPSELHELTGSVIRAGQKYGVPTPTHDLIFAALLPQEKRARGEAPYQLLGVPGGVPHVAASQVEATWERRVCAKY